MLSLLPTLLLSMLLCVPLHANSLNELRNDISDTMITTKITAQFAESKNLNPLKISIDTNNGIVTLRGYVTDKQAFVDALQIATRVKGVRTVQTNDLFIKNVNLSLTDALITARVETAILKAKVLDDDSIPLVGISATTTNGVVTLSGQVNQAQSITHILNRVTSIQGVKKIITFLVVKDKP